MTATFRCWSLPPNPVTSSARSRAGAKDFISKPIDRAEVLTRVYNLLEVRLLHVETRKNSKMLEQTVERLDRSRAAQARRASRP